MLPRLSSHIMQADVILNYLYSRKNCDFSIKIPPLPASRSAFTEANVDIETALCSSRSKRLGTGLDASLAFAVKEGLVISDLTAKLISAIADLRIG